VLARSWLATIPTLAARASRASREPHPGGLPSREAAAQSRGVGMTSKRVRDASALRTRRVWRPADRGVEGSTRRICLDAPAPEWSPAQQISGSSGLCDSIARLRQRPPFARSLAGRIPERSSASGRQFRRSPRQRLLGREESANRRSVRFGLPREQTSCPVAVSTSKWLSGCWPAVKRFALGPMGDPAADGGTERPLGGGEVGPGARRCGDRHQDMLL
jgi:hypothetical protein